MKKEYLSRDELKIYFGTKRFLQAAGSDLALQYAASIINNSMLTGKKNKLEPMARTLLSLHANLATNNSLQEMYKETHAAFEKTALAQQKVNEKPEKSATETQIAAQPPESKAAINKAPPLSRRLSQSEFTPQDSTKLDKNAETSAFDDLNKLLPLQRNAWRNTERNHAYSDKLNEFIQEHGEYIAKKGFSDLEKRIENSVRHTPAGYSRTTLTTLQAVKKDYKELNAKVIDQAWGESRGPKK